MDRDNTLSVNDRLIHLAKDPITGKVNPEMIQGSIMFEVSIRRVLAERKAQISPSLE